MTKKGRQHFGGKKVHPRRENVAYTCNNAQQCTFCHCVFDVISRWW